MPHINKLRQQHLSIRRVSDKQDLTISTKVLCLVHYFNRNFILYHIFVACCIQVKILLNIFTLKKQNTGVQCKAAPDPRFGLRTDFTAHAHFTVCLRMMLTSAETG